MKQVEADLGQLLSAAAAQLCYEVPRCRLGFDQDVFLLGDRVDDRVINLTALRHDDLKQKLIVKNRRFPQKPPLSRMETIRPQSFRHWFLK